MADFIFYEDTGDYIPVEEADAYEAEQRQRSGIFENEAPGFLQSSADAFNSTLVGRGITRGGGGIIEGVLGGVKALEDVTDFDMMDDSRMRDIRSNIQDFDEESTRDRGALGRGLYSAVSSATQQLPTIGLGLGLKGSLGLMGLNSGLQEYNDLRDDGYSPNTAGRASTLIGLSEAATELLPTHYLTKTGTSFGRRLIGDLVTDIPGELANTGFQGAVERHIGRGTGASKEDYLDTAIASAMGGPILAGAGRMLDRGRPGLIDEASIADIASSLEQESQPPPAGPIERQPGVPESFGPSRSFDIPILGPQQFEQTAQSESGIRLDGGRNNYRSEEDSLLAGQILGAMNRGEHLSPKMPDLVTPEQAATSGYDSSRKIEIPEFNQPRTRTASDQAWAERVRQEAGLSERETNPENYASEVRSDQPHTDSVIKANIDNEPSDARISSYRADRKPVDINPHELQLSDDVPNFKLDANRQTGESVPLQGQFDDRDVGPIQVWLRNDGRKEVISGRHRWQHARRTGQKQIAAQIYKESEGFGIKDAQILDAELNIRDGQGTTRDYVNYFSKAEITAEQAKQKGLFREAKGRAAFAIAKDGSPDLISLHLAGKLSDQKAEVIANTAPNDPDLQRAGIAEALKAKTSPDHVENFLNSLIGSKLDAQASSDQGSIFDMGSDAAMVKARLRAKAATQLRDELNQSYLAVQSSAIRADEARRRGIPIENEASLLAENVKIGADLDRWKKWHIHGDLSSQVDERAAEIQAKEARRKARQKGSIRLEALPPIRLAAKLIDALRGKGITAQNLLEFEKHESARETSQIFLEGDDTALRFDKSARAAFRKFIIFPKTLAEKFPSFTPIFERAMKYLEDQQQIQHNLYQAAGDFFDGGNNSKVNSVLAALRLTARKNPNFKMLVTKESMTALAAKNPAWKLTDSDVDQIVSVRNTMDLAVDILAQKHVSALRRKFDAYAIRADQKFRNGEYESEESYRRGQESRARRLAAGEQAIIEGMGQLKREFYVPFGREGDYFVVAKNDAGEVLYYTFTPDKQSAGAKILELKAQNPDATVFKTGKVENPARGSVYEEIPANVLEKIAFAEQVAGVAEEEGAEGDSQDTASSILWKMTKKQGAVGGFKAHLIPANLTDGFSVDFHKNIAKYIISLSNYAASTDASPDLKRMLESIDTIKEGRLREYATDYIKYLQSNGDEFKKLRQALFHYFMGFNPKSALVNLTQTATTTYPALSRLTKNPAWATTRAAATAAQWRTNPEKLAKSDPDLYLAIQEGVEQGYLSDEAVRNLQGAASGVKGSKVWEMSAAMFSAAEKFNRTTAFIAGYRHAPKGANKIDFAKRFVRDTQFIYNKANRPKLARGYGAAPFLFKLFSGNMIRTMRDAIGPVVGGVPGKQSLGTAGRMLLVMAALAGAEGIPVAKELIRYSELFGLDPKLSLRIAAGDDAAEMMIHGLPAYVGVNISGSLALGSGAPEFDKGPEAAITNLVLGATGEPINRARRAVRHWNQNNGHYRAFEDIMPEAIRNPMVAYRGATEGWRRANDGSILMQPTASEVALKAAGITPTRYAQVMEREHSKYLLSEQGEGLSKPWNMEAARLRTAKDREGLSSLHANLREYNRTAEPARRVKLDEQSIKKYMYGMKYGADAKDLKYAPKRLKPQHRAIIEGNKR